MAASEKSSSGNYFWHQGYRYSNKNYYHVSFLTVIAKIFVKYASKQVSFFMDEFPSKYHFRISEGLQCTAMPVHNFRICKLAVDNSQAFGTLLTDLSKAFDYLPDEYLIVKSNAHGFSFETN